jgi:hypothetical protein
MMEFIYDSRTFQATNEVLGPYVVAQASPVKVHLPGEKQDAVFNKKTGELVAGPFGSGYRIKLFLEGALHHARPHHWYNGPTSHSWIL